MDQYVPKKFDNTLIQELGFKVEVSPITGRLLLFPNPKQYEIHSLPTQVPSSSLLQCVHYCNVVLKVPNSRHGVAYFTKKRIKVGTPQELLKGTLYRVTTNSCIFLQLALYFQTMATVTGSLYSPPKPPPSGFYPTSVLYNFSIQREHVTIWNIQLSTCNGWKAHACYHFETLDNKTS